MAILQTPVLHAISPFDPRREKVLEFYYEGSQSYKNRIVITDNERDVIVYDKTTDSMRLYALIPAGLLAAGRQYLAQIQVYDMDGNHSGLSDPVLFYCFTAPAFGLEGITDGYVCRNASINLLVHYSQAENERLKSLQYFLYSGDKAPLSSSDVIYSPTPSGHSFYGLQNNSVYCLRAMGETVHGMKLDTGYIEISVIYNTVPANVVFQAENNRQNGYIQLTTNIISIGYEVKNDHYTLKDGLLTLKDNYLLYNDGFQIKDDFSLFVEAKNLPLGKFLTTDHDILSLWIINVCGTFYCRLNVGDSPAVYCVPLPKARLCTDDKRFIVTDSGIMLEVIDTAYDSNDLIVFEVKRKNGIYGLDAYYKPEGIRTEVSA